MYLSVKHLVEAVGGIERAIDQIRTSQVLVETWQSSNADRYRSLLSQVEYEAVLLRKDIEEQSWRLRALLAEAEA